MNLFILHEFVDIDISINFSIDAGRLWVFVLLSCAMRFRVLLLIQRTEY